MPQRVLVSLSDEHQEFQLMQASEGRAAGARLGLEVEIAFSQNVPSRQLRLITDAIQAPAEARPVAIVIHANTVAALQPIATVAVSKGVGWVVLDEAKYLDRLRQAFPEALVALVTADNRAMGALQARLIRALLPAGGAILSVEGPGISPVTAQRREGMAQALGPSIRILKAVSGDWTEASGESAVAGWLQFDGGKERPLLVASQNDAMAIGARRALAARRPEWGNLLCVGCDGLPNGGQRQVREGTLEGTVVQPTSLARALELVPRWLRGEKIPPATLLEPTLFPPLEELERTRRG